MPWQDGIGKGNCHLVKAFFFSAPQPGPQWFAIRETEGFYGAKDAKKGNKKVAVFLSGSAVTTLFSAREGGHIPCGRKCSYKPDG